MTDTDLRALFDAWLRDRAQVHKLANLSSAVLRAYTEAVTAAAVRTPSRLLDAILAADERGQGLPFAEAMEEASRYLRRHAPAEAPPAAEEGSGGTVQPAIPTGGNLILTRRGYERGPFDAPTVSHTDAEIEAMARDVFRHGCAVDSLTKRRTIEHTSPTGALTTESDAERYARAEAMFSGPRRPRNREDAP